jgi:hypothetical protein
MEDTAGYIGGDPHVQRVHTRVLDVDGVVQPVAGIGGTYVGAASCIGAIFDSSGICPWRESQMSRVVSHASPRYGEQTKNSRGCLRFVSYRFQRQPIQYSPPVPATAFDILPPGAGI